MYAYTRLQAAHPFFRPQRSMVRLHPARLEFKLVLIASLRFSIMQVSCCTAAAGKLPVGLLTIKTQTRLCLFLCYETLANSVRLMYTVPGFCLVLSSHVIMPLPVGKGPLSIAFVRPSVRP